MVKNNTTACTKIYERTPYSFSPLETAGCPARRFRAWVLVFRFRPTLRLREAMSCLLTGNWRKRAGVEPKRHIENTFHRPAYSPEHCRRGPQTQHGPSAPICLPQMAMAISFQSDSQDDLAMFKGKTKFKIIVSFPARLDRVHTYSAVIRISGPSRRQRQNLGITGDVPFDRSTCRLKR